MAERVVPLSLECERIRASDGILSTWEKLLSLGTQDSCVVGLEPLICAICTASCPNKGLFLDEKTHKKLQDQEALKILETPGLLI